MNVPAINFTPTIAVSKSFQSPVSKSAEQPQVNKLGAYPSYYCPNISFGGSKFGTIDFDYDFYDTVNDIINNHLDKMELTKGLSKDEQKNFRNTLLSSDKTTLAHFMFDKKPSVLLNGECPYFKNNDQYSFVRRTIEIPLKNHKTYIANNIFIINKELTKQTIDENKELYTKRMKLDADTPTEEIYEELIGENSPLKYQEGYDDIIGVTLGFSPINSVLFQVEQDIPNKLELRKQPRRYAKELDKSFNSANSPYKDFSDEFKTNIQTSIDYIKNHSFRKPDLGPIGYAYIHIAPDKNHTQKIIKDAESIIDEAGKITG